MSKVKHLSTHLLGAKGQILHGSIRMKCPDEADSTGTQSGSAGAGGRSDCNGVGSPFRGRDVFWNQTGGRSHGTGDVPSATESHATGMQRRLMSGSLRRAAR